MPLRDLLKKKDKIQEHGGAGTSDQNEKDPQPLNAPPEFTFMRTTTDMQEIISPPSFPADDNVPPHLTKDKRSTNGSATRRLFHRRKKTPELVTTSVDIQKASPPATPPKSSQASDGQQNRLSKRLEDKFHIRSHSRTSSAGASSVHVPTDLPEIQDGEDGNPENEAEWEKRALLLAGQNDRGRPATPNSASNNSHGLPSDGKDIPQNNPATATQQLAQPPQSSGRPRSISDAEGDINIQEAIRLHESGGKDLERSTQMLRRLADEQNNAMAQVLYGLALRHGWGCPKDEQAALGYLSQAASNSALVEATALSSGTASSRGGPAKGELVLAIYELANSFRRGWGCKQDPFAARKYYETAANLGDTDAMAEVAWCYLEGFGGPKDKFMAAKYLRMAEAKGVSEPGNSWIWKDKYSSREAADAGKKDKKASKK